MKKAVGLLPSPGWLVRNGYSGLYAAMLNKPEEFTHIEQVFKRSRGIGVKRNRTLEDHVRDAEQLAKEQGKLPGYTWLVKHGYKGMYVAMRNNPKPFQHLEQDSKRGKTLDEHVQTAEQLEKAHGKLPNPGWLDNNGLIGLRHAMRLYPKAFRHIMRHRKLKTLDEHVQTAEQLEKAHGKLPNPGWLRNNGHSDLDSAIRNNPEAFKHLK